LAEVHRERKRKHVTLQLLWLEYKTANPDRRCYTQFCVHYRHWLGRQEVVMRFAAVRRGRTALYMRTPRLLTELALSGGDARYVGRRAGEGSRAPPVCGQHLQRQLVVIEG